MTEGSGRNWLESRLKKLGVDVHDVSDSAASRAVWELVVEAKLRMDAPADGVPHVLDRYGPPEDLFPGLRSVPDVAASELNERVLASALHHHAALVVRGLYDEGQMRALERTKARDRAEGFQPKAPFLISERALIELLLIYEDCGLLDLVTAYLGARPVLLRNRITVRGRGSHPTLHGNLPWHQDGVFFKERKAAVNCWASVSGCGVDRPSLRLIPYPLDGFFGFDPEEKQPGKAVLRYGEKITEAMLAELTATHPAVEPILEPGDAIFFDEMTLHATGATEWKAETSLETISWFFRPDRANVGRPYVAA